MKSKDEMSPMDSWISFSPGKAIGLNAELQDRWIQKAREFRKMRGDVLTASFEIENLIDQILSETFFPGLSSAPVENADEATLAAYMRSSVLKNTFDGVFLKTSGNTFGRKASLFRDVSNEVQALSNLLTEQTKADLRRCVDTRNAFGHSPISFEMAGDETNPDFAAVIVVAGEMVELTQVICDEYKRLFSSVIGVLREIFENLKRDPKREGNSPLSKDGIIWMGHIALSDDAWRMRDLNQPLDLRDFYLMASRPNLKLDVNFSTGSEGGEETDSNEA